MWWRLLRYKQIIGSTVPLILVSHIGSILQLEFRRYITEPFFGLMLAWVTYGIDTNIDRRGIRMRTNQNQVTIRRLLMQKPCTFSSPIVTVHFWGFLKAHSYIIIRRSPSVPPKTRRPVTAHRPIPLSHLPILSAMKCSCFPCCPATHLWMQV